MLAWLVDNTGLLTFILAAIAVGCFAYGWSTGRGRHMAAGLVPIALIAILWLLGRFVVSDRVLILRNLEAMAVGVEKEKYDDVLKHVSKDFRFGPITAADLTQRIKGSTRGWKIQINLSGKEVTMKGDTADVYFNFNVDVNKDPAMVKSARAHFVREDGDWKMKGLDIFRIGTETPEPIPGIN